MTGARRWFAALLLLAPARAQVARLSPVDAPAFSAAALSPVAASGAAAIALAPPALAAPIFSAAPLAAEIAPAALPAPAAPTASDGDKPRPRRVVRPPSRPATTDAAGRALFDGAGELRTRSGAVFVPSRGRAEDDPRAASLLRPAPAAATRTVAGTEGLRGRALLARLGEAAARGHSPSDYYSASRRLFSTADNHVLDGEPGVTDAYTGAFIPGTSQEPGDYADGGGSGRDGWSRAQTMNVEHVFPQSFFHGALPMRSDLHHLMATLQHPNLMRGRLPFGVVDRGADYRNAAGAKRGGGFFEPPDFSKGRVARAMFYFYARYRREPFFDAAAARFWNAQIDTLLDWNRRFPPTVEEVRRNDHVEAFQGNRNPFVDDAGLADRVGRDAWLAPVPRAPVAAAVEPQAPSRRGDAPRKGKKGRPNKNKPRRFRRRSRWGGFSPR